MRTIEDIAVFYKKQCTYNPIMKKGKIQLKNTGGDSKNYNKFDAQPHLSDEYYPINLLDFPLQRFKNGHPTQKPSVLEEYLIKTYTNENEIVLDNCMGSGTTAVACIKTKRNFLGFEKDTTYCDIANKRIQDIVIN